VTEAAAAALAREIAGLKDELFGLRMSIAGYVARGKQTRRMVRALAASVVFDVLLSAGLAYGIHRAETAAAEAGRASSTQVVNCKAGNESRKIQSELWGTVLALNPAGPVSAEEQARLDKFTAYITEAFELRDCTKLR